MEARKIYILIVMCVSTGIISCDIDIPIKEMVKARTIINQAGRVMAEKYDPEHFNKAIQLLKMSHDYLIDKKANDAKKAAEESFVYGDIAVQTSLPRATDDALADAKAAYQEAEKLYAERFAPGPFSEAGNAVSEAETFKNNQNLWDAFLKANEAAAAGKQAKEISLAKVPELTESLNAMKKDAEDLGSLKLNEQQKRDLAAVKTNLGKAGDLISQNNVKDAVSLMEDSENTLNGIKLAGQKVSARDRIAQLRGEVERLKKKRGTEFAGEDIGMVTADLNEADSLLDQDKTDAAVQKISEAEHSLAIAREKTIQGLARDKAVSVEKLLDETKKRDTQNKFQKETERATELINDGKKLLGSESYRESLVKFEEAESLLNSLGVAREKDFLEDKGTIMEEEGKRVYQVVYNRKKRDCLWRIAGKVYRNARLWPLIYTANKDQIKDPDLIFPGQRFVIPEIPDSNDKKSNEQQGKEAVKEENIEIKE
ncbi:MAG: hypothetical protein A2176_14480 [Spirochaetes bacterium RBG_13_51_14]|nr:MAG: hypothetical protein A2176_14480 [Spirochaetes bacterium RBG_13_51_14]